MKFFLAATLALSAAITPAMAADPAAEVTIKNEAGEHKYSPAPGSCTDALDAKSKVTSITVQKISTLPECTFYTDHGCAGDKWTIRVAADNKDGTKTQTFSKPFYVGSLICTAAQ